MHPIWVLVNCNNSKEAKNIGETILGKRLGVCFEIIPRELTTYFWPPKSGKLEEARGSLLIIETFEEKYLSIKKKIEKLHSDKLSFIGYIAIQGTDQKYQDWIKEELK